MKRCYEGALQTRRHLQAIHYNALVGYCFQSSAAAGQRRHRRVNYISAAVPWRYRAPVIGNVIEREAVVRREGVYLRTRLDEGRS